MQFTLSPQHPSKSTAEVLHLSPTPSPLSTLTDPPTHSGIKHPPLPTRILLPILRRSLLSRQQQQPQHQSHLPPRQLRPRRSRQHEHTQRIRKQHQIRCHRLRRHRHNQQTHCHLLPWLPQRPQLDHQRRFPSAADDDMPDM